MRIRKKLKIESKYMQIFWENLIQKHIRITDDFQEIGLCSTIESLRYATITERMLWHAVYNAYYPEYNREQINLWLDDEKTYKAVYDRFLKKIMLFLQIAAAANNATALEKRNYWWTGKTFTDRSNRRLKTLQTMLRYHQLDKQDFYF